MIDIKQLSCGYGGTTVLSGLNLKLKENEFTVLIGPNGAGKSTLLHAIMGFVPLYDGDIIIDGTPQKKLRRSKMASLIAFVPQETHFLFDYSVEDIVLMGRYPMLQLMQSWSASDHQAVQEILASMELASLKDRNFNSLSGGEKQRVLIARALAQNTKYIFLDETLSQLDINHQVEIMQMLADINKKHGIGILLISHNLNLAANYAQRIVLLKSGSVLADGNVDKVLEAETLKQLFGMHLQVVTNPSSGRKNILYPAYKQN